MKTYYKKLEGKFEELAALGHAMGILGWDEQTMMPENSGQERSFAMSKLAGFSHRLITSDEIGEYLERAESEELGTWEKANFEQMKKAREKSIALPSEFVEKKGLTSMKAQQAWRKMRPENDWKGFLPYFEQNIEMAKEEANMRAQKKGSGTPYDALLELYEPGLTQTDIDHWFGPLESELPELIREAEDKSRGKKVLEPQGPFSMKNQEMLGRKAMEILCYDFSRGRLDIAVHPFCGGARGDVRITTRYREDDFQESLMGVIHETGHAQYEQNLPKQWGHQPVGSSVGMAIHESQSLFFEMQVGRSEEFLDFFAPEFEKAFTHVDKAVWQKENIVPLYQRVKRDFIRVNADEVTYPAHILVRYHIEKDLLSGRLAPKDLPERWNEEMKKWLGLETLGNDKNGCMQDVHWPSGAIGYFPTYTLGAMVAAQLCASFKKDHPDWSKKWSQGDFADVRSWLEKKIWSRGSLLEMKDLVKEATGRDLDAQVYLGHLRERYLN